MSKKIRNTPELMEKFKQAFEGKKTVLAGEGLSRAELRKLERLGLVERLGMYKRSKWVGVSGSIQYIWRKR